MSTKANGSRTGGANLEGRAPAAAESSAQTGGPAASAGSKPELNAQPGREGHVARSVLIELADLLAAERAALVCLDRGAIEEFANRKLELDQALQRAVGEAKLGA